METAVKWLARPAEYQPVWHAMRTHAERRTPATPDEVWLCEHAPVYTLGQAGLDSHLLAPGAIPVVRCDRGGQVTYHGPGQVTVYPLVDLRRAGIYVRDYVALLEDAVIATLAAFGVAGACRQSGAPGVYVPHAADGTLAKIAALGLKVRNGAAYHGVSLNVHMDLAPYLGINPCGYAGLRTTDMASCGVAASLEAVGEALAGRILAGLRRAPPALRAGAADRAPA